MSENFNVKITEAIQEKNIDEKIKKTNNLLINYPFQNHKERYLVLIKNIREFCPEKAIKYIELLINDYPEYLDLYSLIAVFYNYSNIYNSYNESLNYLKQGLKISMELEDSEQIINFNKKLFNIHADKIIYFGKAFEYLKKLLVLLDENEGQDFLENTLTTTAAYSGFKEYLLEIYKINCNITCEKLRNIILKNTSN